MLSRISNEELQYLWIWILLWISQLSLSYVLDTSGNFPHTWWYTWMRLSLWCVVTEYETMILWHLMTHVEPRWKYLFLRDWKLLELDRIDVFGAAGRQRMFSCLSVSEGWARSSLLWLIYSHLARSCVHGPDMLLQS